MTESAFQQGPYPFNRYCKVSVLLDAIEARLQQARAMSAVLVTYDVSQLLEREDAESYAQAIKRTVGEAVEMFSLFQRRREEAIDRHGWPPVRIDLQETCIKVADILKSHVADFGGRPYQDLR